MSSLQHETGFSPQVRPKGLHMTCSDKSGADGPCWRRSATQAQRILPSILMMHEARQLDLAVDSWRERHESARRGRAAVGAGWS